MRLTNYTPTGYQVIVDEETVSYDARDGVLKTRRRRVKTNNRISPPPVIARRRAFYWKILTTGGRTYGGRHYFTLLLLLQIRTYMGRRRAVRIIIPDGTCAQLAVSADTGTVALRVAVVRDGGERSPAVLYYFYPIITNCFRKSVSTIRIAAPTNDGVRFYTYALRAININDGFFMNLFVFFKYVCLQ